MRKFPEMLHVGGGFKGTDGAGGNELEATFFRPLRLQETRPCALF